MPPDPVMRARARLFLKDFESQLFINMSDLESQDTEVSESARKKVTDILMQISPILGKQAYLLHDTRKYWIDDRYDKLFRDDHRIIYSFWNCLSNTIIINCICKIWVDKP